MKITDKRMLVLLGALLAVCGSLFAKKAVKTAFQAKLGKTVNVDTATYLADGYTINLTPKGKKVG
jgi:hypothetical protein